MKLLKALHPASDRSSSLEPKPSAHVNQFNKTGPRLHDSGPRLQGGGGGSSTLLKDAVPFTPVVPSHHFAPNGVPSLPTSSQYASQPPPHQFPSHQHTMKGEHF